MLSSTLSCSSVHCSSDLTSFQRAPFKSNFTVLAQARFSSNRSLCLMHRSLEKMQTAASSVSPSDPSCLCLYVRFFSHVLKQKYLLTSLTVGYESTLSNLPPVSSEDFVVLTQPTTPLGADLRHINIHHNTGAHLCGQFWNHCSEEEKRLSRVSDTPRQEFDGEAEIISSVQLIRNM